MVGPRSAAVLRTQGTHLRCSDLEAALASCGAAAGLKRAPPIPPTPLCSFFPCGIPSLHAISSRVRWLCECSSQLNVGQAGGQLNVWVMLWHFGSCDLVTLRFCVGVLVVVDRFFSPVSPRRQWYILAPQCRLHTSFLTRTHTHAQSVLAAPPTQA